MDITVKICKTCQQSKPLDCFKKEPRCKEGYTPHCRECLNKKKTEHRLANHSHYLELETKRRHSPRVKEYQKQWWDKNKEIQTEKAKERYYANPTPYLERSKQQKLKDPDKYKIYQKEYRKENRVRLGEYDLRRYHSDIRRKIRQLIGSGIRKRLNGEIKKSKSISYVGCTWEFLIGYLEAKFSSEMSWDNIGSVWHLDHIIPCRAFDFTDEEQIKKCFHYTNLQPLLAIDNCSKQDKLPDGTLARNLLTSTLF